MLLILDGPCRPGLGPFRVPLGPFRLALRPCGFFLGPFDLILGPFCLLLGTLELVPRLGCQVLVLIPTRRGNFQVPRRAPDLRPRALRRTRESGDPQFLSRLEFARAFELVLVHLVDPLDVLHAVPLFWPVDLLGHRGQVVALLYGIDLIGLIHRPS
jgi:hypothetical protein